MLKNSSTSNSESLRRFGLRCALFFAPLLVLLVYAAVTLEKIGELPTANEVVELQEKSQVLYYPLYQPKLIFPAYKLIATVRRRPEILILGSSRALSIRNEFVRSSANAFYNAALYGRFGVGVLRQFLMHLPSDHLPRFMLVDIDPWWFGQGTRVQPEEGFFLPPSRMEVINFAWRNGIRLGRQQQFVATPSTLIGMSAKIEKSGVRPDGSFYAERRFFDSTPRLLKEQLTAIKEDPGGPLEPSTRAIHEMREFLSYCKSHHIEVVGYLSSIYPVSYDAMKLNSRLAYYWQVAPALASLFREQGDAFFDLLNPATAGCSASEYLDSFHESDVCAVRLLLDIANQNVDVGRIFDTEKLERFLKHRTSDWQLGF